MESFQTQEYFKAHFAFIFIYQVYCIFNHLQVEKIQIQINNIFISILAVLLLFIFLISNANERKY